MIFVVLGKMYSVKKKNVNKTSNYLRSGAIFQAH